MIHPSEVRLCAQAHSAILAFIVANIHELIDSEGWRYMMEHRPQLFRELMLHGRSGSSLKEGVHPA